MAKFKRYFIVLMVVILTVGSLPITVLSEEGQRTIITNLPSNISISNFEATATQLANNQIVASPNSSPNLQAMVWMNTALRQLTEHAYLLLLYNVHRPAQQERIIIALNSNLEAVGRAITHVRSATTFSNSEDNQNWENWRDTIEAVSNRQFSTAEDAFNGLNIMWGNVVALHRDTAFLLNNRPNHQLYLNEITGTITSVEYMQNFPNRWDDEENRIVPADQFDQSVINELVNTSQFRNLVSRNEVDQDEQVRDQITVMAREFSTRIQENIAFVTLRDPVVLEAEYLAANPESTFHFLDRLTGPNMWEIISGTAFDDLFTGEEGASLRDLYLAGFAATAAHIPFVSHIGDDQFMDVVTYLLGVQGDVDRDHEVRARVGEMLQFSKPLIVVHGAQRDGTSPLGASYLDVSGPASRLTLAHLLYALETNGSFAAGVKQGHMIQSGDTWEYFNAAVNVSDDGRMFITTVTEEGAADTILTFPIRVVLELDGNMQNIVRDRNWWNVTADGLAIGMNTVNTWFANTGNRIMGRNDRLRNYISGAGSNILENPTPGSITYGLMVNTLESLDMRGRLVELSNQPLLLTVFGDIITTDGLVIIPAAANPTFFAQPVTNNTWIYNPFTAAFFNAYPVISGSTTNPMVANNRDMGKWFFTTVGATEWTANWEVNIPSPFARGRNISGVVADLISAIDSGIDGTLQVSFLPVQEGRVRTLNPTETAVLFPYFLIPHMHTTHRLESVRSAHVMTGTVYVGRSPLETQRQTNPIQLRSIITSDGITILPHYFSEVNSGLRSLDERRFAARIIGANMLAYITQVDNNGNIVGWLDDTRPSGNGILREHFMFTNVALPVLDGMVHPRRYHQNAIHENMLLNQDAGVFSRHFRNIAHSIISTSFTVENFIGVSSPTDGSILSPIYQMIYRHWNIVFLLLATVLLIMFIFTRNFTKTAMAGGSILVVTFVLLYLVPIMLPTLLGNVSNAYTRRLVQQSMLVRGENHATIFSNEMDLWVL